MMRKILRPKQTGLSTTTMWDWQRAGLYPPFFKIGRRAAGLYEDEHERLMALRAAGATERQVMDLVKQIHRDRKEAAKTLLQVTAA
jgi:predicted DNA-binding transcriptional regulator AlpA